MMMAMKKVLKEAVISLSEKYGFDKEEALLYIMPAVSKGRPANGVKRVVNKKEMVEDVIDKCFNEILSESDSTSNQSSSESETESEKPKKKTAPNKAKAATVAEPVVVAEAVVVAEEKPKKKAAARKAKTVEPVAVAEPVVVAEEKPKKAAATKKAKAATVAEPEVVAEKPKKKKASEKTKAEPEAVDAAAVTEPVKKTEVKELEEEALGDDEEGTAVKEWVWEENGLTYLKSCDNNCDEDSCNCSGAVYDTTSEEQVGTWTGAALVGYPNVSEE